MTRARLSITLLSAAEAAERLTELGALLQACVQAGASVGFVQPHAAADSAAFWRDAVLPAVRAGTRLLLVAQRDGALLGTVQLDTATPPNQRHRAEVAKLLVHPAARRQGIARALMAELERRAVALGRSLITLDTRSGDAAETLYAALGYRAAGRIPGYCRHPLEARLESTTVMYKVL